METKDKFSEILKNQRLVILPKDLIVYLFEDSEKIGLPPGPRDWMAREAGKRYAQAFMDSVGGEIDLGEIPELLEKIYDFTGMGKVKVSINGNEILLEFIDSPLFKSSLEPEKMLRLFLGVVEGFLSGILGKEVKGEVRDKSYILKVKG
ncbi:MAG: hypothetical protein RQ967_00400 [Candidatus Caldipriscus sp.]|nr:hypothetical protein [Candidatus Caldipriscus sp.]